MFQANQAPSTPLGSDQAVCAKTPASAFAPVLHRISNYRRSEKLCTSRWARWARRPDNYETHAQRSVATLNRDKTPCWALCVLA